MELLDYLKRDGSKIEATSTAGSNYPAMSILSYLHGDLRCFTCLLHSLTHVAPVASSHDLQSLINEIQDAHYPGVNWKFHIDSRTKLAGRIQPRKHKGISIE